LCVKHARGRKKGFPCFQHPTRRSHQLLRPHLHSNLLYHPEHKAGPRNRPSLIRKDLLGARHFRFCLSRIQVFSYELHSTHFPLHLQGPARLRITQKSSFPCQHRTLQVHLLLDQLACRLRHHEGLAYLALVLRWLGQAGSNRWWYPLPEADTLRSWVLLGLFGLLPWRPGWPPGLQTERLRFLGDVFTPLFDSLIALRHDYAELFANRHRRCMGPLLFGLLDFDLTCFL